MDQVNQNLLSRSCSDIQESRNLFGINTCGKRYSKTASGVIELYKNGELIKSSDYISRSRRAEIIAYFMSMIKNIRDKYTFWLEIKPKPVK